MNLLFLHGAHGLDEDRELAERLAGACGAALQMPVCSEEDMSYESWASVVRPAVAALGPDDLVVGHSFGGTILLKVLAEAPVAVRRALVLAAPDLGPDGWDQAEYQLEAAPTGIALSLHHCEDDEVVPISHLGLLEARLPGVMGHPHPVGGHQFQRLERVLVEDARALG